MVWTGQLFKFPQWGIVVPILLCVFWLGAQDLNVNPFWGDEWATIGDIGGVFSSPRSLSEIWGHLAAVDPRHTLGYHVLLSGWLHLSGPTAAGLRTLSLFIGVFATALMYQLGRLFVSGRGAVVAALLFGTSILTVHYLTKIRMYGELACLTALVLYLYFRLLEQKRTLSVISWLTLMVSVVALLYTHYYSVVPLSAIGLYHVSFVPKNRKWWLLTGAFFVAAIMFLPWLNVLLTGMSTEAALERPTISAVEVLKRLLFIVGNGSSVLAIGLLLLGFYATSLQKKGWRLAFLVLVVLGVLFVLNAEFTPITYGRPRYFLVAWPFLYLLIAFGLQWLAQRGVYAKGVSLFLMVALVILGFWNGSERLLGKQVDEFDAIFPMHLVEQTIGDIVQTEDVVISFIPDGASVENRSSSRVNAVTYSESFNKNYVVTATEFYDGQAREEREYRSTLIEENNRLWLAFFESQPFPSLNELRHDLMETHYLCAEPSIVGALRIEQYVRYSPVCCIASDITVQSRLLFGDRFSLVDSDIQMSDDSGAVDVVLAWRMSDGAPIHAYSATVQLFNDDGEKVAQNDYGLAATAFSCNSVRFDLAVLPAGTYRLEIAVYNWQTGESLTAYNPATGDSGTMLPLDSVVVTR